MTHCDECDQEVYFKGKCRKHYRLQWNTKNREKVNEYSKKWKQAHKKEIQQKDAEKYAKHKSTETSVEREIRLLKARERYLKNREQVLKQKKIAWQKRDKEKFKEKNRLRAHKRYHSNPQVKLANVCRKRLALVLTSKAEHTTALIGCSWSELQRHLESKFYPNPLTGEVMSWDNFGKNHSKWQIDHIRPLSSFDLTDSDQLKNACNYKNLQPLWYEDHVEKTRKDNSESILSSKEITHVE